MKFFFSDDGSYNIIGIDSNTPVFRLSVGAPFTDKHIEAIEKYKCRVLGFELTRSNGCIDLSRVTRLSEIIRIHINFFEKGCDIVFPKNKHSYKSLLELSLDGHVPLSCDRFELFSSLKYLNIKYSRKVTSWMDNESIKDLVIHDIKEVKLMNLSKMKSLKRIQLNGGKLESLVGIEKILTLETVLLVGLKKLKYLDSLLECEQLKNILVSHYKTNTNWSFLSSMKKIEHLSFQVVDDIDFIEYLPQLKFLYYEKVLNKNINKNILNIYERIQLAKNSDKKLPFYSSLIN